MQLENLIVKADFAEISNAMDQVGKLLDHTRVSAPQACMNTELVLAELLNNIAEHGKLPETADNIKVQLEIAEDAIKFQTLDRGTAMPGMTLPEPRKTTVNVGLQDLPEGGFGWFMIHQLATSLSYERVNDMNKFDGMIAMN